MAHFPEQWWHANRPLIVAHRGASHAAPENTLAAFRRAVEEGADGVELDVHLSADGIPVVIHNPRVDATTDGRGTVAEMSLQELRVLDAGGYFAPRFAGERVPTLEEVLEAVGEHLLVNVELKDPGVRNWELVFAVVSVVERVGMTHRVWFSSFKPYLLYAARALAPEIPRGLLYGPLSLISRLLGIITPYDALHPYAALVRERSVQRAHRRGLRVAVWTVDDVAAASRLARLGVDAIITNEPARLRALFG